MSARAPEFGHAILPVGAFPTDGVPRNGEEYLAMVRHEASLHPHVMVHTDTQPAKQHGGNAVHKVPPLSAGHVYMPTHAWCAVFLERFRRLQHCVTTPAPTKTRVMVPPVHDEARWYAYVHGRAPPKEVERKSMVEANETSTECSDSASEVSELLQPLDADALKAHGYVFREPSLHVLQQLDASDAIALTKLFRKWMQHAQFTQGSAIHPVHARWLFGILACVDRRLSSEDIATLRTLARACTKCIIRVRQSYDDALLEYEAGAWMLIIGIIGVWGQLDLWHEIRDKLHEAQRAM